MQSLYAFAFRYLYLENYKNLYAKGFFLIIVKHGHHKLFHKLEVQLAPPSSQEWCYLYLANNYLVFV